MVWILRGVILWRLFRGRSVVIAVLGLLALLLLVLVGVFLGFAVVAGLGLDLFVLLLRC